MIYENRTKSKLDDLTAQLNEAWDDLRKGKITHAQYHERRDILTDKIKTLEEGNQNGKN
ncbi:TPA: hypothetical protein QCX06_002144 [Bacillus paranthracis]|nr:hypothetical protein [Bacillus paranthracis]HDR7304541.1 hypothetical protein [Bacillus paranthracis]